MLKRHIEKKFIKALDVFPVMLLTGARQTGKTTLVKKYAQKKNFTYITLDDPSLLLAAKEDPKGFLSLYSKPLIIDEVQRAPELFLSIKQYVDEDNKTGQFILTGSANPLFIPKIGDSLAGRMGIIKMYPFSQGEILEKKETFLPWVFSQDFTVKNISITPMEELGKVIYKGGFPRLLQFQSNEQIETWIDGYLQTMIQRDVRDLAQIEGLYHFPALLNLIASRSGSLFNGADIARSLNISTTSVHRYLTLLETVFMVFREQAWFSNLSKRITKSPKIYLCDTGILSYFLKLDEKSYITHSNEFGFLLESFVISELLKQASWEHERISQYHYREGSVEVDCVLEERGGRIVGIEVKKAQSIKISDFKGLKKLQSVAKNKFVRGIVLYSGNEIIPFGKDLFAVPISALWN